MDNTFISWSGIRDLKSVDMSFYDVAGRICLVTGASSGIGHHFATTLVKYGAKVAVAGRRIELLKELAQNIGAIPIEMNVTDQESIVHGFSLIEKAFGKPITVVVNNAGVSVDKPALEQSVDDWDQVLNTNLRGPFFVAQEAAKRMLNAGCANEGSIINVASILGVGVTSRLPGYCSSKAGLIHLTHQLALEWSRHGIRVNAIAPGYIQTEMNEEFFNNHPKAKDIISRVPLRRIGKAEELDGALLLLASQKAGSFMTGAVLPVDGGHLVSSL